MSHLSWELLGRNTVVTEQIPDVRDEALDIEAAISPEASPRRGRGLLVAFRALRQRNYRLYFVGQLINIMGSAMQLVGQTWLVLQLTHNAFQLGLVGALQLLPTLLFSVFAGVLADRWPKRAILISMYAVSALQGFIVWWLAQTHAIQLWHLYLLAPLLGLANCIAQPARFSFVLEMTGREDLPNAVALNSTLMNLARILGPGIGGVIIATSGVSSLFLLNGISYLAIILALALMNPRELHIAATQPIDSGGRPSAWLSLREGFSFIWHTPALTLAIVVVGLHLLFSSNFNVLLPLFATDVLHAGPKVYGFLIAAMGAGSLLAALVLAWGKLKSTIASVLLFGALVCAAEIALSASRWFIPSLVALVIIGVGEEAMVTLAMTLIQLITPHAMQGRVNSVNILFLDGTVPPGYLMTGWAAGLFGVPITMALGALLALAVVAIGWLFRAPAQKSVAEAMRA